MQAILVPVSYGELVDKVTILEIKAERMSDPSRVAAVISELDALRAASSEHFGAGSDRTQTLAKKLKEVNIALWEIEDAIRDCERRKSFGEEFVGLARAVYKTNDERAAIKREINVLLGSPLREEKSYISYD